MQKAQPQIQQEPSSRPKRSKVENKKEKVAPKEPPTPRVLIEDHALIGDLHTAALVGKDGTIDFLCLPDFNSETTFVSLLGTEENGQWKIAPTDTVLGVTRRYRGKTLILETEFRTQTGRVLMTDFMALREQKGRPHLVRIIEGIEGEVAMHSDLRPRFGNGYTVPKISQRYGTTTAMAGPDAIYLRGGVSGHQAPPFQADLQIKEGDRVHFVMSWAPAFEDVPLRVDTEEELAKAEAYWEEWAAGINPPAEYQDLVIRSLLTLKACIFDPTGAIVAAPTFGLPETPGGERNWDYRFCWVRDSVLTLNALMHAGLRREAVAFGDWLQDAIGGAPEQLQIMYGIRGERRLTEVTLPYLEGYGGAKPVRIGNGAYDQFQLDVLGEFASVLYIASHLQGSLAPRAHEALKVIAERVANCWQETDHGIWEMRGPTQAFVASKMAGWAAVDRYVQAIEAFSLPDDKEPWVALRQTIFDEICDKGYDAKRNTFTQYYGSKSLDASLLGLPLFGFLPAKDPRIIGTVKAIEEDLMPDGLVLRYRPEQSTDGLEGEEGVFLPCSLWLANVYHQQGRQADARKLFEKVAGLVNDVGLLAEEYLVKEKQQTGNFPQAFSHLALVTTAYALFKDQPLPGRM